MTADFIQFLINHLWLLTLISEMYAVMCQENNVLARNGIVFVHLRLKELSIQTFKKFI